MPGEPEDAITAGLYELLVTTGLDVKLGTIGEALRAERTRLEPAEAADRIALHLHAVVERAVEMIPRDRRVAIGIRVARQLVDQLDRLVAKFDAGPDAPIEDGVVLRAIERRLPDGSYRHTKAPLIPLLDTTLLTNAPGEPRVGHQVQTEIESADRIDMLMAFIRRSGIAPLRDALARHCGHDRPLRVLTTTYTGSTERAALDQLADLGAEVRVSYDTASTRLHAKAWLLRRESGFSTAYIGSSNLTHAAQVSGLEWNVRVSAARNPDVIDKIEAVFESYWAGGDFRPYDPEEFSERTRSSGAAGPVVFLSPLEIRPEPFQERLLEQLTLARKRGQHRNLLVAATGTGKTVMAALDYAALRAELPRARLLFVAHRQEILDQSQATFRHVLRDAAFGEQWIGARRPRHFEHVFASVQSLANANLADLAPTHFDVVIVDEFHHAAAPTYDRLLAHVEPRELLGLTATPERADGRPILDWFAGRIAAELRLWDAIDRHYLTPFAYFGIHDGLDLTKIPWQRGRGYDIDGLNNLLGANDIWARKVVQEVRDRADDLGTMRALGFCVSIAHASFMARVFTDHGIQATAVTGETPADERLAALRKLREGDLRVVFSVDLFNEGVDVPSVDTLLFLRPTDSPTLFLQQLGRGLRRSRDKTTCLVLDFVGLHRREFRFDRKLRALLGGTRKDLERHVEEGFPFLPAGCHMSLDAVASDIVLQSIRAAIPSKWREKVAELRSLRAAGHAPTLASYTEHSGLEPEDVYTAHRGWSDLCQDAGVPVLGAGPMEAELRRAIGRTLHIDDTVRIDFQEALLAVDAPPNIANLSARDRRLARMLVAPLVSGALGKRATLQAGIDLVWQHPQIRDELRQLLPVLSDRLAHVHHPLDDHPGVPLQVHARYSRLEILAAFGEGAGADGAKAARVAPWQTGCWWAAGARADLFAFTLDKTKGTFSPTTRYRDYAISRDLIRWESQTATSIASDTGQRYLHHAEAGTHVMLFARLRQTERAFWFLGPATYVRHEGDRPIAITWRLEHKLPGDLFASFAAAVA